MKKYLFSLITIIVSLFLLTSSVFAQDKLQQLSDQIAQYEQKIKELVSQANTLANQIAQFDAQIKLAELKISQTQEQIILLGGRITELEGSLSDLSNAFSGRAIETYKMSRLREYLTVFLTSDNLSAAVARFHYLQKIQEADRQLLVRLQNTQNIYIDQKSTLEKLQTELQAQKTKLDAQKKAKAQLLTLTRNDERKYQELLAASRAELEAIQAIIAGRGEETGAGHINEGQKIASIIQGSSCNSGGAHLHFIVSESGITKSPFSFLKSIDYENCSGSSCGSSDGDSFSPSGSWSWPISPKVKFTQGYGATWAVKNTWVGRIYNFHNGIDIDSMSDNTVKAVRTGNLYRGSYTGTAGCRLRYVRVDHDENNIDTFYLHVNY